MKLDKITNAILLFIGFVIVLYFGKTIILPFAIAILIFFVIQEINMLIGKVRFKQYTIPSKFRSVIAFGVIILFLIMLSNMLYANIQNISDVLPMYQVNINKFVLKFSKYDFVDFSMLSQNVVNGSLVSNVFGLVVDSITSILSNSFLIFLYLIFLMLERSLFEAKVKLIYTEENKYNSVRFILDNIGTSMSRYISLKTTTSLVTGILSFVVLKILDIDFAFFWAFLIFVLNFIPTIGSLVATVFPALIALVQFGTFIHPVIVLTIIGFIQFLVGNVIEPKLMGNSLNISPLVVLIMLAFWGLLWGITGMILSVPITIMIIIASSQFESTKWIAIILSENGKVLDKY